MNIFHVSTKNNNVILINANNILIYLNNILKYCNLGMIQFPCMQDGGAMMYLAKNLRYLRLKNRFSQEDIADRLGYKSYTTVQKWETGISEPSLKVLNELAELFRVDLERLMNTDLEAESEPLDEKSNERRILLKRAAEINDELVEPLLLFMDALEKDQKG